jgi:hypothetical protein
MLSETLGLHRIPKLRVHRWPRARRDRRFPAGRQFLDGAQDFKPFLMAMSLHALPDDAAGGDIESSKQRRCSIAFIVVGHGPGPTLLHRQAGPRAIERWLYLVDREYQGFVRWIEIMANEALPFLRFPAGEMLAP